jgi:hypothetical protein
MMRFFQLTDALARATGAGLCLTAHFAVIRFEPRRRLMENGDDGKRERRAGLARNERGRRERGGLAK